MCITGVGSQPTLFKSYWEVIIAIGSCLNAIFG